ncbi:MAG: MBL fold metallo-hydrolase [Alphaproteobacteria bacterium]|nr:MBL fold metallo-hydrolase [Alphaproteobacteria bacterium]
MKITVLGCGTSSGVPMVGCRCAVCRSDDPRNRRRRVSILVEHRETSALVDTSPDLREQLLSADISRLDAVIYTHGHADHSHGIDDLRPVNYHMNAALNTYGTEETLRSLQGRFAYAFGEPKTWWHSPSLRPNPISGPFDIGALKVTPFEQVHGRGVTIGYVFGEREAAYSTDVNELSDEAIEALRDVRLWVVDCLGYQLHPSHANLDITLGWIKRVKPRLAVLTHMSHQFDYAKLSAELPEGVVPGHDGLVIETDAL